jgi:hypothetical protein
MTSSHATLTVSSVLPSSTTTISCVLAQRSAAFVA